MLKRPAETISHKARDEVNAILFELPEERKNRPLYCLSERTSEHYVCGWRTWEVIQLLVRGVRQMIRVRLLDMMVLAREIKWTL
jgi:hypothetical protein